MAIDNPAGEPFDTSDKVGPFLANAFLKYLDVADSPVIWLLHRHSSPDPDFGWVTHYTWHHIFCPKARGIIVDVKGDKLAFGQEGDTHICLTCLGSPDRSRVPDPDDGPGDVGDRLLRTNEVTYTDMVEASVHHKGEAEQRGYL